MQGGGATFGTVAVGVFDSRGLASGSGNRRSQLQVVHGDMELVQKWGKSQIKMEILDRM